MVTLLMFNVILLMHRIFLNYSGFEYNLISCCHFSGAENVVGLLFLQISYTYHTNHILHRADNHVSFEEENLNF